MHVRALVDMSVLSWSAEELAKGLGRSCDVTAAKARNYNEFAGCRIGLSLKLMVLFPQL